MSIAPTPATTISEEDALAYMEQYLAEVKANSPTASERNKEPIPTPAARAEPDTEPVCAKPRPKRPTMTLAEIIAFNAKQTFTEAILEVFSDPNGPYTCGVTEGTIINQPSPLFTKGIPF